MTEVNFADLSLLTGPGGERAVQIKQTLPDEYIDGLKEIKNENDSNRCREFFHVGSVPDYLFLKWLREGYDARIEPVAETLKRLRIEASVFALTNKRI